MNVQFKWMHQHAPNAVKIITEMLPFLKLVLVIVYVKMAIMNIKAINNAKGVLKIG